MSTKPTQKKDKFAQLQVTAPCTANWEQMSGNRQKRFCAECDKHVFDFAQMTARQVTAVVEAHQGNLCARLTRLPDGSLLTLETPPVQISNRRSSPLLNATIAALLGISVPATALNAILASTSYAVSSNPEAGKRKSPKPIGEGDSSLNGSAHDPQGNALPNAFVKLISSLGEERQTKTSAEGEFLFARIPAGEYLLLVGAQGYATHLSNNITIESATKQRVDVAMQLDKRIMIAGGMGAGPPQTLLDLYRNSDLIVVAEAGQSVPVERDGESKLLKTTLRVASVLKGDSGTRTVPLYHWMYDDIGLQFKPGERRLVFLDRRRSDEGKPLEGFELADWGRSIKPADDAALAVYQQRLQELARLLERKDASPAELAEWLVQLAEHPLTRQDGVQQLLENSWIVERQNQDEQTPTEADEETVSDETEEAEEAAEESTGNEEADEQEKEYERLRHQHEQEAIKVIEALTPEHKNRLAGLLFSIESFSEEDLPLAQLISNLGDERLTPYLIAQLQKVSNEAPRIAETLTSLLAENLEDEDLRRVAGEYGDSAVYGNKEEDDLSALTRRRSREQPTTTPALATIQRSLKLKKFLTLVEYKLHP